MKKTIILFLLFLPIFIFADAKIVLRQNYYTNEDSAEILIDFYEKLHNNQITIKLNNNLIIEDKIQKQGLNVFKISITNLNYGNHKISVNIDNNHYKTELDLQKLKHKSNAVKIDKKTGSLIVENYHHFPFGFYCYTPVQNQIAEQEVVQGFNMMSPYQQINKKNRKACKIYMDRCAELGMKVHYNLCSVAGGGGAGSHKRKDSPEKLEKLLIDEVNYFKDHPALLGWYIADEPVGQHTPVEIVENSYKIIKKIDPYHPIGVVFMTPSKAIDYKNGMDVVMTDPYPVPSGNIRVVSDIVKKLKKDFYLEKAVWLVPQAFGGNEWWKREPGWREIRMMTYQGIINGVTGIQYFVRHGLNSFPKSTAAWNEAGKIALEVKELSPFLLNFDEKNNLKCKNKNLDISYWEKDGGILIGVVNKDINPQSFFFSLKDEILKQYIDVLFEHRKLKIINNQINDFIDGYGTRFYLIENNIIGQKSENLFINSGFENNHSSGVPAGCYAKVKGDLGSTYFIDKFEKYDGDNSLSIITPEDSEVSLGFFRSRLRKGNSYRVSIMAKKDDNYFVPGEKIIGEFLELFKGEYNNCKIGLGNLGNLEFIPTNEWKRYEFFVQNNSDSEVLFSPLLIQKGAIKVWYDNFEILPDPIINYSYINKKIIASIISNNSNKLKYKIGTSDWKNYHEPIEIEDSGIFSAGIFIGEKNIAKTDQYFEIHKAINREVKYKILPAQKYFINKYIGLTDGIRGSMDYRDGLWQGIEKDNLELFIDLGKSTDISELSIGFLQSTGAWIFMPEYVEYYISDDGINYTKIGKIENNITQKNVSVASNDFQFVCEKISAKYLKIFAKNIEYCPEWHRSQGGKAFMFFDEIIVH